MTNPPGFGSNMECKAQQNWGQGNPQNISYTVGPVSPVQTSEGLAISPLKTWSLPNHLLPNNITFINILLKWSWGIGNKNIVCTRHCVTLAFICICIEVVMVRRRQSESGAIRNSCTLNMSKLMFVVRRFLQMSKLSSVSCVCSIFWCFTSECSTMQLQWSITRPS
jgi:hypothetical protein